MELLKFSYHILCKRLFNTVAIIIQIVALLFILCNVVESTNEIYKTINVYNNSGLAKLNGVIMDFSGELPKTFLDKIEGLEYCEQGETYTDLSGEYNFLGLNTETVNDYKPSIKKGSWLNDFEHISNTVPVVLPYSVEGLNVGDIINLEDTTETKIHIIGILKDPNFLCFRYGGTAMTTKQLMAGGGNASLTFLTLNKKLSVLSEEEYIREFHFAKLIVVNNKTNQEKALKTASEQAFARTFKQLNKISLDEAFARFRILGPFILLLFLVSTVGLSGCVALSTLENLKLYSILNLQGASRRNIMFISSGYVGLYLLISLILFGCVYFVAQEPFSIYSGFAIFLTLFLLSLLSFVPYNIIKRKSSIECFRENE